MVCRRNVPPRRWAVPVRACSDVGFGFVASEVVPADGEGGTALSREG